jgi:hypothetical protein
MPDRLADVINVKDWGAKGDGANDDTAAIQNAINYCISTANGTKQPGGKVFFPAGRYIIPAGSYLYVGSSNPNARAILQGAGQQFGCSIFGNYNGFLISQGSQPYDNLQRFEGIDVWNTNTTPGSGCIKVTGTAVGIRNAYFKGMTLVDASQAQGCTIFDVLANGVDDNTTTDGLYPFSKYGVGFYLGNCCIAQNCRIQGSEWITFALSGHGAACIGCSTEVTTIAVRFGWVPGFNLSTSQSASVGATTLNFSAPLPSSVVAGLIVSGNGIPESTNIVSVNSAAGTIVISSGLANAISSNTVIIFTVDTPAIGCVLEGLQTERCATGAELYNAEACVIQGNAFTGRVGPPWGQPITGMRWNSGTHVVTAAVGSAHNLPPATVPLVLDYGGQFGGNVNPWWTTMFVNATRTDATHFQYPGPSSDPGSFPAGVILWTYPLRYSLRCRKARECAIISNDMGVNAAYAEVDFDYGSTESPPATVHSNNIYIGNYGGDAGWNPPTDTKNLAGWYFSQAGSPVRENSVARLATLVGQMTVADLPGQFSDPAGVYQPGPIEGQEYTIRDCSVAASGNFAVAVSPGEAATGGGSNHVKVRYDGTKWRISG